MKYYLMFDLGTGNSRVALVNSDGEIIDLRSYANTYYRDDSYKDSQWFEPAEWQEMLFTGCDEMAAAHPDIEINGISAAAARQSFVLINGDGECFMGLPNIDNRGHGLVNTIPDMEGLYRRTGKWGCDDLGAGKIIGLKKKYFGQYAKIYKFTSLSEWIGYLFTGEIAIEYSQASETQLYDLTEKDWSREFCDWYEIDFDILPTLIKAGERLGHIKEEFRERFHLSDDAVFIVGGGDTQIGIKQTGIEVGDIAIVSGTTSPVVTLKDDFFYDPEQRVWTEANLGGDTFQIEMNPGVTGMNYQRMKAQFAQDISYEELEEYYRTLTDISCTASFSSLLFYKQRGLKHGGFFMRSPLQDNVCRNDLMFAVLADIACATYEQLRRLIEISGNDPEYILACGGGFQSDMLCRMTASLAGRPVKLIDGFSQATVQGLVNICNDSLEVTGEKQTGCKIYEPEEDNIVFKYYPVWSENRNRANKLD